MIDCISVENMRQSDANTIANLVSSLELMHRAAFGVFQAVQWHGQIAIIVGSGNNGGDGFALACILHEKGYNCSVFTVSSHMTADSAFYAEKSVSMGVPVLSFTPRCLSGYSMVVDCLLGTGFQGEIRENYRIVIEAINVYDAFVVSVDINSGMNGDTGEAELAVHSDLTVTIGYVKQGLITANAGRFMEHLVCADIGIPLIKQEWKIGNAQEALEEGCFLCPPWLDMRPILTTES